MLTASECEGVTRTTVEQNDDHLSVWRKLSTFILLQENLKLLVIILGYLTK